MTPSSPPAPSRLEHARILDAAPDGIVCIDGDGRVAYANRAAADLLGYVTSAELLGQVIWSHMQFLERASANELCWRVDGTGFPVEYSLAPVEDAYGMPSGTVVTFRDVSERRAAERARDELISVVSHELRTPLTAIRSAVGLLAAHTLGPVPEPAERLLQIAVNNSDRLIRLVNDLLDLERARSGESHLHLEDCELEALMSQAVDGVQAVAGDAGVTLHLASTRAHVTGDADRLLQVLTNLLANAIKFSEPGGSVWLDAEQSPEEVVLRVRDEGCGIPASQLETIFNRFAQVDAADAREKGGTGLGLAISRAIIEQHGGQIWAESTLGAGTTLCVALPTREASSGAILAEAA